MPSSSKCGAIEVQAAVDTLGKKRNLPDTIEGCHLDRLVALPAPAPSDISEVRVERLGYKRGKCDQGCGLTNCLKHSLFMKANRQ